MVDVDIVAGSSFSKLELLIQSHESQVDAAKCSKSACPACHASDCLTRKDIRRRKLRYLRRHPGTSISSQGKAVGYESEEHALSHTTLWRFLTWLGAMTISLSRGVDLFQKAFPESTIHRFTGSISPSKFRSESRAESLRNADRLLNLISRWDTAFPKERFFPRFATKPRAP